jgi:hypothetical protein
MKAVLNAVLGRLRTVVAMVRTAQPYDGDGFSVKTRDVGVIVVVPTGDGDADFDRMRYAYPQNDLIDAQPSIKVLIAGKPHMLTITEAYNLGQSLVSVAETAFGQTGTAP